MSLGILHRKGFAAIAASEIWANPFSVMHELEGVGKANRLTNHRIDRVKLETLL